MFVSDWAEYGLLLGDVRTQIVSLLQSRLDAFFFSFSSFAENKEHLEKIVHVFDVVKLNCYRVLLLGGIRV